MIFARLDRCGREFMIVSASVDDAKKKLVSSYKSTYRGLWGVLPDADDIETARDEISIKEIEIGKIFKF